MWCGAVPSAGTGAGLRAEVRLGAAPCALAPAGSGAGAPSASPPPRVCRPRPRPVPVRPSRSVPSSRAPLPSASLRPPGFLCGKEQPAWPVSAGPERARGRQPRSGAQLPGPRRPAASRSRASRESRAAASPARPPGRAASCRCPWRAGSHPPRAPAERPLARRPRQRPLARAGDVSGGAGPGRGVAGPAGSR